MHHRQALDRSRLRRTSPLLRPFLRPVDRLRAPQAERDPDLVLVLEHGGVAGPARLCHPSPRSGVRARPGGRHDGLQPQHVADLPARTERADRRLIERGAARARRDATCWHCSRCVAALLFLPGLGRRDLWNPDEPRYAEVAREMRADRRVPGAALNGRGLHARSRRCSSGRWRRRGVLLGGLDETAARLPSALAAIGSVLLVYSMGARLFDRRAAWLAAIVFATCSKILWQGAHRADRHAAGLRWCCSASGAGCEALAEERPAFSLSASSRSPASPRSPRVRSACCRRCWRSSLFLLLARATAQGFRDLRLGRGLLLWCGVVVLVAGAGGPARRRSTTRSEIAASARP